MKARTVDCVTALLVATLCTLLLLQLKNIPREGALFPSFVLWLLIGCCACLAGRALVHSGGKLSFLGGISAKRWITVCAIFLLQVLGALFISFKICMFLGIFILLQLLAEQRTKLSILVNTLFAGLFVLFFELFFSNVMHIYFPEPLLDAFM